MIFVDEFNQVKLVGFENSLLVSKSLWNYDLLSLKFNRKPYKAPELIENLYEISWQSDIWALGCIIFKILFNKKAFLGFEEIMKGDYQEINDDKFKNIFDKVFAIDPCFRPSCENLLGMMEKEFVKQDKLEGIKKIKDIRLSEGIAAKPISIIKTLIFIHKCCYCSEHQEDLFEAEKNLKFFIDKIPFYLVDLDSGLKEIIYDYIVVILEKIKIVVKFGIKFDWSDASLEIIKQSDLLNYLILITDLSSVVVSFDYMPMVFENILKLLVSEILVLNTLLIHSFSSDSIFQSNRLKLSSLIPALYSKHPFIQLSINSIISKTKLCRSNSTRLDNNSSLIACLDSQESISGSFNHLTIPSINDSEIKIIEKISSFGSSADVFKGFYKKNFVAVKVLRENVSNFKQEFFREVSLLSQLSHFNLLQFIGTYNFENRYSIVTEYCSGGSLFNYIQNENFVFSVAQKIEIALGVARGMKFLHSQSPSIVHRDLKSLNILIERPVKTQKDKVCVKIADFGISRRCDYIMMTADVGTSYWKAPEVISGEVYGPSCDVYSFSILLWEILCHKRPYLNEDKQIVMRQIRMHKRRPSLDDVPNDIPDKLKEIMQICWKQNPSKRPTFDWIYSEIEKLIM